MTRYLFCALLLLTALLSGCATQMDVSIDATPDPDYHFDRQATVLVTTSVGGSAQSTLNARYYLRDMVNAMKDQGFREVFTDTTLPKHHAPIKMTVTLDVDSRQVTYRYTATDYGQVPTSTTTQCKKNKKDDQLTCTSKPNTTYGPVGTSERTGYTTLTTFTATARDEVSRRAVYLLRAMSYNEDCQAAKIETFLVEQGLQNLNFQDRVHRNYTVTMPEGYQCK